MVGVGEGFATELDAAGALEEIPASIGAAATGTALGFLGSSNPAAT